MTQKTLKLFVSIIGNIVLGGALGLLILALLCVGCSSQRETCQTSSSTLSQVDSVSIDKKTGENSEKWWWSDMACDSFAISFRADSAVKADGTTVYNPTVEVKAAKPVASSGARITAATNDSLAIATTHSSQSKKDEQTQEIKESAVVYDPKWYLWFLSGSLLFGVSVWAWKRSRR